MKNLILQLNKANYSVDALIPNIGWAHLNYSYFPKTNNYNSLYIYNNTNSYDTFSVRDENNEIYFFSKYENILYNRQNAPYWAKLYGESNSRPDINTQKIPTGYMFFDTDLNMPVFNCGSKYVTALGYDCSKLNKGTSEERPSLNSSESGFDFYDTTLKKKILWNGTAWVNMDGTALA